MYVRRFRRLSIATCLAASLAALTVAATQAHVLKDFGKYSVALGWVHEPTYVGQLNAVQVVVKDAKGKPVIDLASGDLKVVVSVGGQQSASLDLATTFDPDTGLGVPGDYEASLVPTAPGDYTFHLTGSIHGTKVDETATSGDSTFNAAVEATDVQFPTKLPSLSQIVTRLDRLDARLGASPSPAQAQEAAPTAVVAGVAIGGVGLLLGAVGLLAASRARRRPGA